MAIGRTRQNPAKVCSRLAWAVLVYALSSQLLAGALSLVKDAWFPGFSANAWMDGLLYVFAQFVLGLGLLLLMLRKIPDGEPQPPGPGRQP